VRDERTGRGSGGNGQKDQNFDSRFESLKLEKPTRTDYNVEIHIHAQCSVNTEYFRSNQIKSHML